jgi:hypothetical protein
LALPFVALAAMFRALAAWAFEASFVLLLFFLPRPKNPIVITAGVVCRC